jgi:hypothetical protein
LFRFARIADQGGERDLRLFEVGRGIDRLHSDPDCRRAACQSRADARFESSSRDRESLAECGGTSLAHAGQSRTAHLAHAPC